MMPDDRVVGGTASRNRGQEMIGESRTGLPADEQAR